MEIVKELKSGNIFSFPGSSLKYEVLEIVMGKGRTKNGTLRNAAVLKTVSGDCFYCYPNELVILHS